MKGETMYNEISKKASMKYMKENLDEIKFRVPKGDKEKYKEVAAVRGLSLTSMIIKLLEKEIKNPQLQKKDVED